jgi:hypothetical protein
MQRQIPKTMLEIPGTMVGLAREIKGRVTQMG